MRAPFSRRAFGESGDRAFFGGDGGEAIERGDAFDLIIVQKRVEFFAPFVVARGVHSLLTSRGILRKTIFARLRRAFVNSQLSP